MSSGWSERMLALILLRRESDAENVAQSIRRSHGHYSQASGVRLWEIGRDYERQAVRAD